MIVLTDKAIVKAKELMAIQNEKLTTRQKPLQTRIRIGVVGGGCSGFSYHMAMENESDSLEHKGVVDNIYEFAGLKVVVDQMSEMYLDGTTIDYVNADMGGAFKFTNPNIKTQCGCGQSFSV